MRKVSPCYDDSYESCHGRASVDQGIGDQGRRFLFLPSPKGRLRAVQPTGMLWRVVKGDAPQELVGGLGTKHILEVFVEMRVEVVEHQVDASCCRIDLPSANSPL